MKRLRYFFILIFLLGGAFYLETKFNIPLYGFFFSKIDSRNPASPQTQLQKAFFIAGLKNEKNVASLVTGAQNVSLCSAVENIYKYTALLRVEGVSVSGEPVMLLFSGDCARDELVVFDKSLCSMEPEQLRAGSTLLSGYFIQATNLLMPLDGLAFFLSNLEVTYRNGAWERVSWPHEESKISFFCPNFKQKL